MFSCFVTFYDNSSTPHVIGLCELENNKNFCLLCISTDVKYLNECQPGFVMWMYVIVKSKMAPLLYPTRTLAELFEVKYSHYSAE